MTTRRRWFRIASIALALSAAAWWGGTALTQVLLLGSRLEPVDIVVFAPHPDDEVLGCGGVIQQALADGKKVRVVFSTHGDGFPLAAAILRNKEPSTVTPDDYVNLAKVRAEEALAAERALGLGPESVVFLGYPDGVLEKVANNTTDTPVISPTTGRSSTYASALPDYHSSAHGAPAPYTREAALGDFMEVLRQSEASEVYAPDRTDSHPDHRVTSELVHDASAATDYEGTILTYVVHSAGVPEEWPWPQGQTPRLPFQQHKAGTMTYPARMPWPPNVRLPMSEEQSSVKLRALSEHRSQWALRPSDQRILGAFIKSEEIFWTGR